MPLWAKNTEKVGNFPFNVSNLIPYLNRNSNLLFLLFCYCMNQSNQFIKVKKHIESFGYKIMDYDFERPWGGFLVIDEAQSQKFANQFFDGIPIDSLKIGGKLSPKLLIVTPKARLSWQYHHRRAEIWRVYRGTVGIIRSNDNDQKPIL